MKQGSVATVLLLALVSAGGFDGWTSTWHAARGRRALERASASTHSAEDLRTAVRELAAALGANPLRRQFRLDLENAVGAAVDGLGAEPTAALAPAATLPRVAFATVLERRRQSAPAVALLAGVGATRAEEIEVMRDAALEKVAKHIAVAGRCPIALPLLEAAVRRLPDDPGVDLNYAGCLTNTGQAARAMPILAHVNDLDPTSKWVHFLLAEAHVALGEIDQAEAETAWLTTQRADFFLGWRLRGDVLAAAHRPAEAGVCYRKALALSPGSSWLKWPIAEMDRRAKALQGGS